MDCDDDEARATQKLYNEKEFKIEVMFEDDSNKINVLGTKYTLEYKSIKEDSKLDEMEGYTDLYQKRIVIAKIEERDYYKDEPKEKIDLVKAKVLRHEIVHAFLYESGLDCNSNRSYAWADNEEMIDWFAIQAPKIIKVYKKLEIEGEAK